MDASSASKRMRGVRVTMGPADENMFVPLYSGTFQRCKKNSEVVQNLICWWHVYQQSAADLNYLTAIRFKNYIPNFAFFICIHCFPKLLIAMSEQRGLCALGIKIHKDGLQGGNCIDYPRFDTLSLTSRKAVPCKCSGDDHDCR